MEIIPAMDILNGKVVRLTQGNYTKQIIYNVLPEEMIEKYANAGINHIHIIDLNGARGDDLNEKYLYSILRNAPLRIQLGGGLRNSDKIRKWLDHGIYKVIVGTVAIKDPNFLKMKENQMYKEQIIIAIDVLEEVIKYNGWTSSAPINLFDFMRRCIDLGYKRFLCTDINKDGKLQGTNLQLYQKIKAILPSVKLIGSGGISQMKDIVKLAKTNVESVVVGKAIYEDKISIEEIVKWNSSLIKC